MCGIGYKYKQQLRMTIAHLGDTRAVGYMKGEYYELTHDHRPSDPKEKERLKKNGVSMYNDGYSIRIRGKVADVNFSRSIGDWNVDGLIRKPAISDYNITNMEFIIFACDGVWDFMDIKTAVAFVIDMREKYGYNKVNIAKLLAQEAFDKYGSSDNISVIILFL